MTVLYSTSPKFATTPKVQERLAWAGWTLLRHDPETGPAENDPRLAEADFLVAGLAPVGEPLLEKAPRLRAVIRFGVGVNNVDAEACAARDVAVLNTPAANSNAVAEQTIGLIFALARQIPAAHADMSAGHWQLRRGIEIRGRRLGLVGLGEIGRRTALKALALGMSVSAYDPYPRKDFAEEHGITLAGLDEVIASADFLSLHAPGGADNARLISRERLAAMPPGACLINVARADLVDLDALAEALDKGTLRGAAIDVFPVEPPDFGHPIFSAPNTILTPHSAADTEDAIEATGMMVCDHILKMERTAALEA